MQLVLPKTGGKAKLIKAVSSKKPKRKVDSDSDDSEFEVKKPAKRTKSKPGTSSNIIAIISDSDDDYRF